MKILGIDTSTDACSVAISNEGHIQSLSEVSPKTHTKRILPMINQMLNEMGLTLSQIDVFAFGRGPGSFTGLRIASSIIQGLAFGLQKPVVPVSSLRAMAQGAHRLFNKNSVYARLDARMKEFYWGVYALNDKGIMEPVSEEYVTPEEGIQLPSFASVAQNDWFLYEGPPDALDIVKIAEYEYELGHFVEAAKALPVYVRDNIVRY